MRSDWLDDIDPLASTKPAPSSSSVVNTSVSGASG